METVKAVKSVGVPYKPSEEVLQLLRDFRDMANYCLKIGLEKNVTGRFRLTRLVYGRLTGYGYHSWYVLSAIEVATVILKNYRKARRRGQGIRTPRARKLMAKIGSQGFTIADGKLRIPLRPREYVYIPLHKRARGLLMDSGFKLGSVTLTVDTVYVSFSKVVKIAEPEGYVAIDVNEDNVTAVSSDGEVKIYNLSRLKRVGYGYFWRRRKIQQRYAKDRRVLRKSLNRLSRNYHNLVSSELHKISASIAKWCKEKGYGLIREDLKGLRKSVNKRVKRFNRFNGKVQEVSVRSKELKRRLNGWWFRKFAHMVDYKCLWFGVRVKPVNPKGSSSICPRCGSKLKPYPMGRVECPKCGLEENRHIVACLNLLRWKGAVRPRPLLVCSCDPRPNKPSAMRKSVESLRGEGISLRVARTEDQGTIPRYGWETVDRIVKPSEIYDGEKAALLIANAEAVLEVIRRLLGEVDC